MKNKPKCLFCQCKLEADSVTVNKGLNPCYSLGSNHPISIASMDEIILSVKCPNCGAYGEALGDKVFFKGNMKRPIIEINNVAVGKFTTGSGTLTAMHPKFQPFNPSRRDNHTQIS